MEHEPEVDHSFDEEHGDTVEEVLGKIKDKLLIGLYDVQQNHHEDVVVITSGQQRFEHRLTKVEAEQLEQAVWSAGEDQRLDFMLENIRHGLVAAGFALQGDHLDITVRLEQVGTG